MPSLQPLEQLVKALSRLPTVGRRSAERMAHKIMEQRDSILPGLILALTEARNRLTFCSRCGSMTLTERNPCAICQDDQRDAVICVVEDAAAVIAIEQAGGYRGRYHVLGGRLSPMAGTGPGELRVRALRERLVSEQVREVCIALNTDVESDATAHYLAGELAGLDVRITRLAFGLPAGSGIEFTDALTLSRAIRARAPLDE
jgi:recombination protein RecR